MRFLGMRRKKDEISSDLKRYFCIATSELELSDTAEFALKTTPKSNDMFSPSAEINHLIKCGIKV
jgi:hypothetical protein